MCGKKNTLSGQVTNTEKANCKIKDAIGFGIHQIRSKMSTLFIYNAFLSIIIMTNVERVFFRQRTLCSVRRIKSDLTVLYNANIILCPA